MNMHLCINAARPGYISIARERRWLQHHGAELMTVEVVRGDAGGDLVAVHVHIQILASVRVEVIRHDRRASLRKSVRLVSSSLARRMVELLEYVFEARRLPRRVVCRRDAVPSHMAHAGRRGRDGSGRTRRCAADSIASHEGAERAEKAAIRLKARHHRADVR